MDIDRQEKTVLARLLDGPATPAELRRELGGISAATLSRLIGRLGSKVVALGKARATRYARTRDIRGMGDRLPVYRIDSTGNVHQAGTLISLWGGKFWWESGLLSSLHPGLPWFIQDMRPEGFTGRAFAHRAAGELGLPQRLSDWNDDDVLYALARRGEECMGDLLVGDESLERYLRRSPVSLLRVPDDYVELARRAMEGDPAGSSAGGEQPKFTALIERNAEPLHVLVKFSPMVSSVEGGRWSDLLVCEHIALEIIREAGLSAATSRLHLAGGRTFLELERFDRSGIDGRLPIHSLGVVDDEHFGRRDSWAAMAGRLEQSGMLNGEDRAALRWLSLFGAMIANTDQHFGNITLIPRDERRDRFTLAPAYDMLPMLYRPRDGEASFPGFVPPMPLQGTAACYDDALHHALIFWERAGSDSRISAGFRSCCLENKTKLEKSAESGGRVIR